MGRLELTGKYKQVSIQHNIVCFVGNGFDLQALRYYNSDITTRYDRFVDFLSLKQFDPDNLIYKKMCELRAQNRDNWSDVEACIAELQKTFPSEIEAIFKAVQEIQVEFANFLALIMSDSIIESLDQDSKEKGLSIRSLSRFLSDLSEQEYGRLSFPSITDHYNAYLFTFINFNYTPLFDNYIYLDKAQFSPHPYKVADRNFQFYPNPRSHPTQHSNENTSWSSYLAIEVVHPHGILHTPRSILFGIDSQTSSTGHILSKPYWSQNDVQFSDCLAEASLFIIFGCSLGASDAWWWRKITERLESGAIQSACGQHTSKPELIIYWYSPVGANANEDKIRESFLALCGRSIDDPISSQIAVVLFNEDSDRVWLSL